MKVTICVITKNKALHTTTLHSIMTLNMICMSKGIHLDIHFSTDRSNIHKIIKNCDRFIFLDYGISIGQDVVQKLCFDDFPEGYKALVVPCVTGEIDWEKFKKKTLEGSTEPVNQRGLSFDVVMEPASKKYSDVLFDFVSSTDECRCFALDCKAVLKKLRDVDLQFKSIDHLKKIGIKIGVLRSAPVTCHHVYECIGNIIDSPGVVQTP